MCIVSGTVSQSVLESDLQWIPLHVYLNSWLIMEFLLICTFWIPVIIVYGHVNFLGLVSLEQSQDKYYT